MKKNILLLNLGLIVLILSACSKNKSPISEPVVMDIKQEHIKAPTINSLITTTEAVVSTIQLRKASLLNRSFFYGAALQFSSIISEQTAESYMGLSLGQMPVEFKIIDGKLRLVTDSRMAFESDINHPSRLIHEFPILSEDDQTITIKADKASPVLATALFDMDAGPTRISWIRSLEFVSNDELFLIESSLEQQDGSVAEILETIRPRDKVIPADFKAIYADPEINDDAARYGFLEAGDIYVDHPEHGRIQTKAAQRFDAPAGKVIEWYVTPNIPDKYLQDVKNGVEAWNRYSQAMWKRDIVKFAGKLPAGIKVGDPRYNLIFWDNIKDAGAAYESQNSDPITGYQMHSMIYLPAAWVNIAKEYWNSSHYSEEDQESKFLKRSTFLKNRTFMGRKIPVNCMEGAFRHVSIQAKENQEEFSHSLLKGVLFHEVGHSLGFAHNFKGSLSFDPQTSGSIFSSSIMDYNDYNVESSAFKDVNSSDGPLLEYDRQLLSVLYNEGKDVADTDEELPACADEESDSEEGGIDPLCIRYDLGKDPTITAKISSELLSSPTAKLGKMTSLPVALSKANRDLPDAATINSMEELSVGLGKGLTAVKATTGFYISGYYRGLMNALRSLHVFQADILPENSGYVEDEMRERTLILLDELMKLIAYPMATKQALASVRIEFKNWILNTPAIKNLDEKNRSATILKILEKVDANFSALETSQLSKMRSRVAAELKYSAKAPLSFHKKESQIIDTESLVIQYLGILGGDANRPLSERAAGITSLATFKNENGLTTIKQIQGSLELELRTTQDAVKREVLRKFLKALQ